MDKKCYTIKICAHMYTSHPEVNIAQINDDVFWMNEFQILVSNICSYLKQVGLPSSLYLKSFERANMLEGIHEIFEINNCMINIDINIDSNLEPSPEIDHYRDHMIKSNDLIWYPAYVQINNVFTRGVKFNSFWTSNLFIKDVINRLSNIDENGLENGIYVQDYHLIFDKTKFDYNRSYIRY